MRCERRIIDFRATYFVVMRPYHLEIVTYLLINPARSVKRIPRSTHSSHSPSRLSINADSPRCGYNTRKSKKHNRNGAQAWLARLRLSDYSTSSSVRRLSRRSSQRRCTSCRHSMVRVRVRTARSRESRTTLRWRRAMLGNLDRTEVCHHRPAQANNRLSMGTCWIAPVMT